MKVLMIAPQPFFEPRGTPISVYQRLHGLSSLGYKVDLITYPIGQDVEIPGVTIHRAPRIPGINKVKIGPSWAKIPLDIMLSLKTLMMVLRQRYDVIHSHEEAAFLAMFLAAVFRIPHIYDMHSSLPKQLANFNFGNFWPIIKIFKFLENLVLKTCDVVLTIGTDLEDYVLFVNRQANHIRIENIAVHNDPSPNAEPADEIGEKLNNPDNFTIVYTGTFEQYQGLDILFQSMRFVKAKYGGIKLVMVGGRPDQISYWKNITTKMGLEKNINFTGIVPLDKSLKYLEIADILVSPRSEGLSVPLKIYSYLHSGKPTVATNITAHTQILNEEIAVLVEPDAVSFADGIIHLIEHPEERSRIGKQARIFAEREFSRKGYLSKLERAYLAIKLSIRISEISPIDPIAPVQPGVGAQG